MTHVHGGQAPDLESLLRDDLDAVASDLRPGPAPVEGIRQRGRRIRRRRSQVGLGLAVAAAAGVALTTIQAQAPTVTPAPAPSVSRPAISRTDAPVPVVSESRTPTPLGSPVETPSAEDAARELRALRVTVRGTPFRAWAWDDRDGRNILLTTRVITREGNGLMRDGELLIYHFRASGPRVTSPLVITHEGSAVCEVDGGLEFLFPPVVVSDADGDGVLEGTIGWWHSCRGEVGPANVGLAVLSGGMVYRLDGEGVPREPSEAAQQANILPRPEEIPAATATGTPAEDDWPPQLLAPALETFTRLFR